MGLYPFMFGSTQDFEPIVAEMAQVTGTVRCCSSGCLMAVQKDMKEPYNWEDYAHVFFPQAEELVGRAAEAEKAGEKEKACELYLYVGRVYPKLPDR